MILSTFVSVELGEYGFSIDNLTNRYNSVDYSSLTYDVNGNTKIDGRDYKYD